DDRDLGREDRSADFCPGKTGYQADFAFFVREHVAEFRHAQELGNSLRVDTYRVFQTFLHHLPRYLAADIADFALQIANARFARIGANDFGDRIVGEDQVRFRQTGSGSLFADQVLLGDFELFKFGVTMKPQHLHADLKRSRNSVQHLLSRDEENLLQDASYVELGVL